MKIGKKVISIMLICIVLSGIIPMQAIAMEMNTLISATINNGAITTLDLTNFVAGEAPVHTHIWETQYDELYHWEICKICFTTRNKTTHKLEGNGGSKILCENGYYNDAYREVCACGYQSKPQVVLHGRYENWATSRRLNYGNMNGVKLEDIKQITYTEFQSISYPATPGGQQYTWTDHDGDGYGWVFMGGPILKDGYGTNGTIETILGAEGDCGRKESFDEAFILARYIYSDSTPTLAEFINTLPAKNTIQSDHLLYGYKEKYQKVTTQQWNQLVTEFKGYYTHTSTYGWTSMNIQHASHKNSGTWIYSNGACYDSSNNHAVNFKDGIKTDCDLCGAHYLGNEDYVANTWYRCEAALHLINGQTVTCSGHTVLGKGGVTVGTVFDTFTKQNGTVTRTKVTATPNSGYTARISANAVTVPKADTAIVRDYSYYGTVTFSNNKSGSALIQRTISCGIYYPLTDDTAPTAYNTGNTNYWKVNGNGTQESSSTQASAIVTFKDPQQYSYNQVQVRVYDADKTTIIPQGNGVTNVPLTKVSGTSGNNTLWQGEINITMELNGTKNIYIQAIDAVGNQSDLIPMQIAYLDSKAPDMQVNVNVDNNTWAKSKLVEVVATDLSNSISIGISKNDMMQIEETENRFIRTYQVTGDVYDGKNVTFYASDILGNLQSKQITINKLDNTSPTITKVEKQLATDKKSATITVIANDINTTIGKSGSGVVAYAMTTTNTAPTEFQTSNVFTVNKNGTYYFWAKDLVGNISQVSTINQLQINDIEVEIKGNIIWDDRNNQYSSRKATILKLYRQLENEEEILLGTQNIKEGQTNYSFKAIGTDETGKAYKFRVEQANIDGYATSYQDTSTTEELDKTIHITNQLILPTYTSSITYEPIQSYEGKYLKNAKVQITAQIHAQESEAGLYDAKTKLIIDSDITIDKDSINIIYQESKTQKEMEITDYTINQNIIEWNFENISEDGIEENDKITVTLQGKFNEIKQYENTIVLQGKLTDIRKTNTSINLGEIVKTTNNVLVEYQQPQAKISIHKTDSITEQNLEDAIFQLYEWNGSTYVEKEEITDQNQDGIYESNNYEWNATTEGKYKIEEKQAPAHHQNQKWTMYFQINELQKENYMITPDYDDERYAITYEAGEPDDFDNINGIVENEPYKLQAKIQNIDKETKQVIQADSTFVIYEWNKETQNYEIYQSPITQEQVKMQRIEEEYESTEWLYYTEQNEGKFRIIQETAPIGYYANYTEDGEKQPYDFNLVEIIQAQNYQGQFVENGDTIYVGNTSEGKLANESTKGVLYLHIADKENLQLGQADATVVGGEYGIYALQNIYHPDGITTNYPETPGLLYKAGDLVSSKTVNSKGEITFYMLPTGTYYIQMRKAPTGYLLDENTYPIDLTYQGESVPIVETIQNITNTVKKQAFQMYKLKETGETLKDAGFSIYLVSDLSIVKEGKIERVTQTNYQLHDEEAKQSDFLKNKANVDRTYALSDLINYYYKIRYEEGQETILPGNEIVYHPYSLEEEHLVKNYEQTTNGIDITEIMTTESGYLQSPKLAYGEYIILETSVPREQKVATPFLVAIEEDSDELQELRFIIDKDFKTKVKIYTNDQKTGNAILGKHIEYVIRNTETGNLMTVKGLDQNQNIVEYGTEKNPFRALNTGYFLTPMELPIGKYVLEQQRAGEGYVKQGYEGFSQNGEIQWTRKQKLYFEVKSNTAYYTEKEGEAYVIVQHSINSPVVGDIRIEATGEFLNNAYYDTKQSKYVMEYQSRKVENATYEVIAKENIYTQDNHQIILYEQGEVVGNITTNSEGIGIIENLPIGKYVLKEVTSPTGFDLEKELIEINLSYENDEIPVVFESRNRTESRQIIEIVVYSRDEESGENRVGGEYGLYTNEDIIYYNERGEEQIIPKDTLLIKTTSDENGEIHITSQDIDLPRGSYYLQEEKAPTAYVIQKEKIILDANINTKDSILLLWGEIKGMHTLLKVQEKDGAKSVQGSTLQIIEEDTRKVVEEWKTTKEPISFRNLETQKEYIIQEIKPAAGYVTANAHSFILTEEGTLILDGKEQKSQMITMDTQKTKIQINWVDEETKEPVEGAKLSVYSKDSGRKIVEWETHSNGQQIIGLPIGSYRLEQTYTPTENGYVTTSGEELEVQDTEKEQIITKEQKITRMQIEVLDKQTQEKIKGVEICIKKDDTVVATTKEKDNIKTIIETENGYELTRLPIGTYILEQKTIGGYQPVSSVEWIVKDTIQPQQLKIENIRLKFDMMVEKTLNSVTINGEKRSTKEYTTPKIEVKSNQVAKGTIILEYNITITNKGEIPGTIGKIVDYIPKGLQYIENNQGWIIDNNKAIHTSYFNTTLQPGESKTVTIYLKWNNQTFGEIENTANIEESKNEFNYEDANTENETSIAIVMIGTKTGGNKILSYQIMLILVMIFSSMMMFLMMYQKQRNSER